jgi:hypothetical protein
MGIVIVGLFVVIFCIFPVMFTARKLGAEKSDLVDCIIAILVATFFSSIIVPFLPGAGTNEVLAYIYSFLVAGLAYKFILQASYVASVLIALISTAITYISLYIVGSMVT